MITRTSGLAAVVVLTGCGGPVSSDFTVPPYPSPTVTRQPPLGGTTDIFPTPSPTPSHRATRSRRLPTILLRIRSCESGPNGYTTHGWAFDYDYQQTNPSSTASGAWQALDGTWNHWDGYRRAKDAPREVQDAFALDLYRREGTSPWNASRACWGAA